jgi:hypothetical protein
VTRRQTHGFHAAVKNGPAAPGAFAADAHYCIMVRSVPDRPNTRLWRGCPRLRWRAPLGFCLRPATGMIHPTNLTCRRARDRQGQVASRWPTATLDSHCARRQSKIEGRDEEMVASWIEQEDGKVDLSLTAIAPYKGFGCRPLEGQRRLFVGRRPKASKGSRCSGSCSRRRSQPTRILSR